MADFTNVRSGFDLELLIDKSIFRHLIQILTESEESIQFNGLSMFKNLDNISRDYIRNHSFAGL